MWLPTHPWHSYYYLRKFDVLKSWLSRTHWTSIYSDNSEYLMFLEETLYILLAHVGLWHTTIHRGYIVEKNQHHHPESPEGRKVWLLEKSLPFLFGYPELSDHALVRIQAGSEVHLSTWLGKKKKPHLKIKITTFTSCAVLNEKLSCAGKRLPVNVWHWFKRKGVAQMSKEQKVKKPDWHEM